MNLSLEKNKFTENHCFCMASRKPLRAPHSTPERRQEAQKIRAFRQVAARNFVASRHNSYKRRYARIMIQSLRNEQALNKLNQVITLLNKRPLPQVKEQDEIRWIRTRNSLTRLRNNYSKKRSSLILMRDFLNQARIAKTPSLEGIPTLDWVQKVIKRDDSIIKSLSRAIRGIEQGIGISE